MAKIVYKAFKQFGITDKVEFEPEEYQAFITQFPDMPRIQFLFEKLNALLKQKPNCVASPEDEDRIKELQQKIEVLEYELEEIQNEASKLQEMITNIGEPQTAEQQLMVSLAQETVDDLLARMTSISEEKERKSQELSFLQQAVQNNLNNCQKRLENWKQEYTALRDEYYNLLSKYNLSSPVAFEEV